MATYTELHQLISDNAFRNRCSTAIVVSATTYLTSGTSTTAQKKWARQVIDDPIVWGQKALVAITALGKGSTITQITNSTDNTLQGYVDSIAAAFADAI